MAPKAGSSKGSDEDKVEDELDDEVEFEGADEFEDDDDLEDEDSVDEEDERSGRRVPVLAIVSLSLIGLFGALIGWLWVSFDESDVAALAPPAVRSEIPPPPALVAAVPIAPATVFGSAAVPVGDSLSAEATEGAPATAEAEVAAEAPGEPPPAPEEEAEVAALVPETEPASEEPSTLEPSAPEPPAAEEPAADASTAETTAADAAAPEPLETAALDPDIAMRPAPDPDLQAPSPNGPLPVIGPDGRQAWQAYGREFTDPEERPRIAILLGPLGLIESASYSAIQQLPANVTLAFAPYTRNLSEWIAQARAGGHEVILHIPMEPFDYPDSDPGPHTLLTSVSADDNIERLEWLLSRASGYIGVSNFMGDRFTTSADHVRPVLGVLKSRGLMFLDAQATRNSVAARVALDLGVPRALNNRFIDSEASRIAIDARLFELERIASSVGTAVGIGFPYPVTIERIASWASTLADKGLVLAPLSAVANRQEIP